DNRPVKVRQNLLDALRALRPKLYRLVLWVDALCINQRNNMEKSKQVAKMGRIFQEAVRVTCWIGTPTRDSDSAIAFLNAAGSFLQSMPSLTEEEKT
ncbi:uncharacterized protein K452DRAFT_239417, partial [Aplosporella prunicola CBS 121167]